MYLYVCRDRFVFSSFCPPLMMPSHIRLSLMVGGVFVVLFSGDCLLVDARGFGVFLLEIHR